MIMLQLQHNSLLQTLCIALAESCHKQGANQAVAVTR